MEKLKWWGIKACWLGSVSLTACSGVVDVGGNAGGAGAQGISGDYASGGSYVGGASGGYGGSSSPYDPSDDPEGTCPAACEDAAGTVLSLQTEQEFFTALRGRWLICGDGLDAFGGAPDDVIGVEYDAPMLAPSSSTPGRFELSGNVYYLVDGTNGPERGRGFDYQLTYDVSANSPGERPVQLNMHPTPNSGFGGPFRYSPCPRQWEISGGSANPGAEAILVPLD